MFPLDCAAWAAWEFKPFPLEQLSSTVKAGGMLADDVDLLDKRNAEITSPASTSGT